MYAIVRAMIFRGERSFYLVRIENKKNHVRMRRALGDCIAAFACLLRTLSDQIVVGASLFPCLRSSDTIAVFWMCWLQSRRQLRSNLDSEGSRVLILFSVDCDLWHYKTKCCWCPHCLDILVEGSSDLRIWSYDRAATVLIANLQSVWIRSLCLGCFESFVLISDYIAVILFYALQF